MHNPRANPAKGEAAPHPHWHGQPKPTEYSQQGLSSPRPGRAFGGPPGPPGAGTRQWAKTCGLVLQGSPGRRPNLKGPLPRVHAAEEARRGPQPERAQAHRVRLVWELLNQTVLTSSRKGHCRALRPTPSGSGQCSESNLKSPELGPESGTLSGKVGPVTTGTRGDC
jgi:hypothetical protein